VSLVYPADATPGHLLSVVPDQQLAQLRQRESLLAAAQAAKPKPAPAIPPAAQDAGVAQKAAPKPAPVAAAKPKPAPTKPKPARPAVAATPGWVQPLPPVPVLQGMPPAVITPTRMSQSLMERYQQAVQAQQKLMNSLMGR
jgi:hypothetical protein